MQSRGKKRIKLEVSHSRVKLYYKVTVIRTVWYWQKNRHTDQWNIIESLETNLYICGQLISTKGPKTYSGKRKVSCNNWYWENWKATCNRMKLNYYLTPYTKKINWKWIKDLNIKPEIIKYIEENIGAKHISLGLRGIFVNLTQKAREVKAKTNEWDYIKLKSCCSAKETIDKKTANKMREDICKWYFW